MQPFVLLGLAALWAAVLLPDFLRRQSARRSSDSISSFNRNLSVLGQANPHLPSARTSNSRTSNNVLPFTPRAAAPLAATAARPAAAPASRPAANRAAAPVQPTRSPAAQRRQDIIVGLSSLALLTLLGMVTFGGAMLYVHLVVDVALVSYLGLVLNLNRVDRMRSSVSYLPMQASPLLPIASVQRRSAAR